MPAGCLASSAMLGYAYQSGLIDIARNIQIRLVEEGEEEEEEEGVYRLTAVYDRGLVLTQDMGAHCNMSSDTDDTLSCSHTQEDEMVEMKELIFNKETILVSAVGSPERKNISSSETKLFCYEMNNILMREKYFVANDDRNTAW